MCKIRTKLAGNDSQVLGNWPALGIAALGHHAGPAAGTMKAVHAVKVPRIVHDLLYICKSEVLSLLALYTNASNSKHCSYPHANIL